MKSKWMHFNSKSLNFKLDDPYFLHFLALANVKPLAMKQFSEFKICR